MPTIFGQEPDSVTRRQCLQHRGLMVRHSGGLKLMLSHSSGVGMSLACAGLPGAWPSVRPLLAALLKQWQEVTHQQKLERALESSESR